MWVFPLLLTPGSKFPQSGFFQARAVVTSQPLLPEWSQLSLVSPAMSTVPDISTDAESVLNTRCGQADEQKVVNLVLEAFPGVLPLSGTAILSPSCADQSVPVWGTSPYRDCGIQVASHSRVSPHEKETVPEG